MKFRALPIHGAFIIESERATDERGYFARMFCRREFSQYGLNPEVAQCSLSHNPKIATLRGMHYQAEPHPETKLIRCIRGCIFDVIVDLRSGSPTFAHWAGIELSDENTLAIYVPEGVAHGFETLDSNCDVLYQMSELYHPGLARGIRWDDPSVRIKWPIEPLVISAKDSALPDLTSLLS
jgi:dTDP-4-dehydrorhamnose 3,5-epimerase